MKYRAALLKANNGAGRETVLSIAKNANASVAINVGSSTLYLDGKVMNLTIGDKDEANGVYVMRHVSDAIVFKH